MEVIPSSKRDYTKNAMIFGNINLVRKFFKDAMM